MSGGSVEFTHNTARIRETRNRPAPTPPAEARDNSPATANNPPPRILVVDDEALLRWSIVEMLSDAGYTVVDAGTGREARLAMADDGLPINGIVVDLKLPDTTGIELLRDARRRGLTCPAILMTAFGSPEAVEQAMAAGARQVVAKPFDLADLLALVRQICPV